MSNACPAPSSIERLSQSRRATANHRRCYNHPAPPASGLRDGRLPSRERQLGGPAVHQPLPLPTVAKTDFSKQRPLSAAEPTNQISPRGGSAVTVTPLDPSLKAALSHHQTTLRIHVRTEQT
ncbi:unnamed protein product [Arctogadus glacialis]